MTPNSALDLSPSGLHASLIAGEEHDRVFNGGINYAASFTDEHILYRAPETGRTLLHALALGGRHHAFQWFFDFVEKHDAETVFAHLDPNATDKDGHTALTLVSLRCAQRDAPAPSSYYARAFLVLLAQNGANIEHPLPTGQTMLQMIAATFPACRTEVACEFLGTLMELGAKFQLQEAKPCFTAAIVTRNQDALQIFHDGLKMPGRLSIRDLFGPQFYNAVCVLATLADDWYPDPDDSAFSMLEKLGIDLTELDPNGRSIVSIASDLGATEHTLTDLRRILWNQTATRLQI